MKLSKQTTKEEIVKNPREGEGQVIQRQIADGTFFANMLNGIYVNELQKNSMIGVHQHVNEKELYYIISGEGEYYDNGTWIPAKPGDLLLCDDGEYHGLKAHENLEFFATIIKNSK